MASGILNGKKVLIISTDGFEDTELLYPRIALMAHGAKVDITGKSLDRTLDKAIKGKVGYIVDLDKKMKDIKVKECGLGIIAQGNKAFFEHELSGTAGGKKVAFLAFCAYEFEGGKIKEVRTTYDRLSMAQQAASGLPKMMVNMIVKQAEKGLH